MSSLKANVGLGRSDILAIWGFYSYHLLDEFTLPTEQTDKQKIMSKKIISIKSG